MDKMSDTGMTPKHRDVVDKLRERLEQYRKHHNSCQTKQERSQMLIHEQERQDAALLHRRAIDSRAKLLNKVKQVDLAGKSEAQANGLEMKSTNAILQQQILKRKLDQGLNNSANILSCDKDNGPGGESLAKYQRTEDGHNTGLQPSHEIPNINLQSQHEHSTSVTQLDSLDSLSSAAGIAGHFVGDRSRGSPLLAGPGVSSGSDPYNTANRVQSPNTLQAPTEFKQETRIAVSCEGGRLSTPAAPHETLSNGLPLPNSRTGDNSRNVLAGQELQQHIQDFEDVLRKYTNPLVSYKSTGVEAHRQLQRPSQPNQLDNVTRDSRPTQQQSPTLSNPATTQKHQFSGPQGPPGPTALHLQKLARHAQQSRARVTGGFSLEGQDQDTSNLNHYANQSVDFFEQMRFTSSGTQSQIPIQGNISQVAATGRFRPQMPSASKQYTNIYSSKDQQQGIMSTGFPSNMTSLQYQHMMQSQTTQQQQQQQQQAMYRLNQQQMSHRLTHPSIPEQQPYQQYQTQQNINQTPQQMSNIAMSNLAAYSATGYQNVRPVQQQFQRQHSMPLMSPGYPTQEQYTQQMQQYPVNEQQLQSQQQGDVNAGAYHYNRRNSFPVYRRTMSQPPNSYAQASHEGFTGPMVQLRNTLHGQNAGNAVMDTRSNASPAYTNYNTRTPNLTAQPGNPAMAHLSGQQRASAGMVVGSVAGVQMQAEQSLGYGTNPSVQSGAQDAAKYNGRPETASGYSDSMSSITLQDQTATSVSVNNNDSQFNAFSPLSALEKAPSFTSLLEQSTGNLETTYTGSIPNLDLLGEIIG